MKNNTNEKWKNRLEFVLQLVALVLLLLILPGMYQKKENESNQEKREFQGWYRIVDGEKESVLLPAELTPDEDGVVTLYNDTLTETGAGLGLTTDAAEYDLQVSLADDVLYQYSDELFPRNDQMKGKLACDINLPAKTEGKTLTFRYMANGEDQLAIPMIYIGGTANLLRSRFSESAPMLTIVAIMVICGGVAILIGLYLRKFRLPDPRFGNIGAFMLLCALWCITDSSMAYMFSSQSSIISTISFFTFMLFSVPMLHYIRNTGNMKKYRELDICITVFYINAILQGILCLLHVFTLIQMLLVTQLILFAGVLMCVYLLFKEYRLEHGADILALLKAFAVLGGSGLIALVMYWILKISYYEILFEIGILIFGLMILHHAVVTVAKNIRYQTEMEVYQRLSKEDKMTGLANRRAFDEFLINLQENIRDYQDAALIFTDLNNLRQINDNQGRSVGDEMIIAFAKCIQKAFGKSGNCFRLGGFEFCIVITDPSQKGEELLGEFDAEIQRNNRLNKCFLSVARGISFLRNEDGSLKRFSDWKYEADQQLCMNRGGQKSVW